MNQEFEKAELFAKEYYQLDKSNIKTVTIKSAIMFAERYYQKQLLINGVVFNEAGKDAHIVTLELNKPMISKLSDWKKNSEVELICDVEKGTKCKDPFPKYRTGVCRNCGGQSN